MFITTAANLNTEELKEDIGHAYQQIETEYIQKLLKYIPRRYRMVLESSFKPDNY